MRILFIGDYSNVHALIANELRNTGHEVTLVSDRGGYMQTDADITLSRTPGMIGGFRYLFKLFSILPGLKGFDVVQLINSNFLKLRPGKIKYFFDRIKENNGKVFLTLAGNDYYFVKACHDAKLFRFSEFKKGEEPTEFTQTSPQRMYGWISDANRHWSEYLYERINGAMSLLPEYDMAAKEVLGDRLTFTNLPLDVSRLDYKPFEIENKFKLFIGMRGGMEIQKGTKYLLQLAKELEREFPEKIEVESVRNLSLHDYLEKMSNAHMVLDQLYSYSPGMNALQAMSMGRIAASGAQPEYYEYIRYDGIKPIFSLTPFDSDIKERIIRYLDKPELLVEMSKAGRHLVEKNNDVKKVTEKFIERWTQ